MDAGQGDSLSRRRLKEEASAGRGRAMTERQQQHTAWAEEAGDPRHCLPALLRVEMIQTAVSGTTSNRSPRLTRRPRCGRWSSIHSMWEDGCKRAARSRRAAVGSTATTRCPIPIRAAASRPVPAPMSSTELGFCREQVQDRTVHVDETNALVLSRERIPFLGITLVAPMAHHPRWSPGRSRFLGAASS